MHFKFLFNKTTTFFTNLHSIYLWFRPLVWFIFVNEFMLEFHLMEGKSMLPTFEEFGDITLVNKLSSLYNKNYKKGELVCVVNPKSPDMKICKRVTHTEGEIVYTKTGNEIIVPLNHIWVEGDNKENSMDSRKFGPLNINLVQGRVVLQIWPKIKLL
jgi:signal peptidase I